MPFPGTFPITLGLDYIHPLDIISTSAYGGYSIRKLRSNFWGNCIRLRRSSDNAEMDFGFVRGTVEKNSVSLWAGADTLYVTTIYDQVGSYNAVQTVAINQPVYDNTNSRINCSLTTWLQTANYDAALVQPNTAFIIGAMNPAVIAANQNFVSGTFASISGTTGKWRINAGTNLLSANNSNGNLHIFRGLLSGVNSSLYIDSALDVTGNAGNNTLPSFTLGTNAGGIAGMAAGYYYSAIVFDSTPTAGDITLLEANQKAYYGIP